ncbi:hypothetical protein Tco_0809013 [Tanacetum coccineum]
MEDSQSKEGGKLGVKEQVREIGTQEGPSSPSGLTQTPPFPAFLKENLKVIRTLIREHDKQNKIGVSLKKLTCREVELDDSGNPRHNSSSK